MAERLTTKQMTEPLSDDTPSTSSQTKTVNPSKQLPTLRAALKKEGLLEVEETCCTSSCSAHGGEIGKSVPEALCNQVDDMEFIIQCAFECHDSEAVDPVRNLLKTKTCLMFPFSLSIAASIFTLAPIGKEVVTESSSIRETLGVSESFEATASSSDVAAAAVGLFTLQNLRKLTIATRGLDDEFFTGMSAAARQSMIEELTHMNSDLGSAASSHYARGLCSMPYLRSLYLRDVELSDEFYSTMASEASKLMTLSMWSVSITPCRLHSILSLLRLQSLSLDYIRLVDVDDGETLTRQITSESVDELSVDGKHVTSLWNLGLHTSCPRVKTLKLGWSGENVSSDIVTMACSPFHHLTHLHIQGYSFLTSLTTLNDPVSFCKAVISSCPRLTKLSMRNIVLFNKKAVEIIQLMKTHPHLTSIELDTCSTDTELDPLISEVNSEGKLTVTATHGL